MKPFEIVFVPGMKPKPPASPHRDQLQRCLIEGVRRADPEAVAPLQDQQRFTLAAWTYEFYGVHRDLALDMPGIEQALAHPEPTPEQRGQIDSLSRRITRWAHITGDVLPWLTRFIANDDLRVTMTEARRYLLDIGGAGRIARNSLKELLVPLLTDNVPVIVMGHSLGSVIAYDTLWELSHEEGQSGVVDLFMTLGSPLGTRFIYRHLKGCGESGARRFPTNVRRWENFSSRGELTALKPALASHFAAMVSETPLESIQDHVGFYVAFASEFGLNVHKSYGYLTHPVYGAVVARWLGKLD